MFEDMMRSIRWEIIFRIFSLKMEQFDATAIERKREHELEELQLQSGSDNQLESAPVMRDEPRIGRNDLCTCGSGKKYKKCHGAGN